MNDSRDDRVRATLRASADDIDLDIASPADIIGRGRARRRRTWTAAGGATVLIVVMGTIVLTTRDDAGSVQTSDSVAVSTTSPQEVPLITTPPTLPPPETDPTTPTTPTTVASPTSAPVATPTAGGPLAPWRDGFVSVASIYTSRPLPEQLPEEVRDLFSPEVLELFADGLPATLDEATTVLSEAGLLEEVSAVLSDHPAARTAILGDEAPPPRTVASFTSDGVTWNESELPIPLYNPMIARSGDELVAWSMIEVTTPDGSGYTSPTEAAIGATSDLAEWRTATIDFDTGEQLPEYMQSQVWLNSAVVVGDRWFALASVDTYIEYERLLPADLSRRISAAGSWGVGTSNDGIEVEYTDETGERVVERLSWTELGLDESPEKDGDHSTAHLLRIGTFGGDSEVGVLPSGGAGAGHSATITRWGDEILYVADSVYTSPDGRTWTTMASLPDDFQVNAVAPMADGLLLVGWSELGDTTALRLSSDGQLSDVVLPELPNSYGLWENTSSPAWVVQLDDAPAPNPVTFTFEHDDLTVTISDGPGGTDALVVETASGDVVVDRHLTPEELGAAFVTDDETGEGVVSITDADTGEELVRIPESAYFGAYSEEASENSMVETQWEPDLWLVATPDGERWITRDLEDPDPDGDYFPTVAAVNGDRAMYHAIDGWVIEMIPG